MAAVGVPRPQPRISLTVITISATPSSVSIPLVSKGVAQTVTPIAVTTSWVGISLLSVLNIYAYFSSPTAALSGGTPVVSIPASAIKGRDTNGLPVSFTPFTQSTPVAGASLQLFASFSILDLIGSRTDNLDLQVDLTGTPQLPAATYSGVLLLQAQAF